MNRQQLTALTGQLRHPDPIFGHHSPTLPYHPDAEPPYDYMLFFRSGLFHLELTLWSGYYNYPATREQPRDEGWANEEEIEASSPFFSDLLGELETLGIPLCLP